MHRVVDRLLPRGLAEFMPISRPTRGPNSYFDLLQEDTYEE
jgi:hypothetical protein